MAKPRIFISSTFYDLKQIRLDLDRFIRDMGYEPIRNEQGNIPFGSDEKLEEYCYKEIPFIDILISIVGGRFGTASSQQGQSISQMEIKTALQEGKQVFIFIDKNVYAEYRTYLLNKENKLVNYHFVDDQRIFNHIEFLESLPKNNSIHAFDSSEDITLFLKEQWAGLFQRFLQEQKRIKEVSVIHGLEKTAATLNQLIEFLTEDRKGKEDTIRDLILSNHPAMERLKTLLVSGYRVFFLTRDELSDWLKARSYTKVKKENWDDPEFEEWVNTKTKDKQYVLKVSSKLFDEFGNLLSINKQDWNDQQIVLEITDLPSSDGPDDLPF